MVTASFIKSPEEIQKLPQPNALHTLWGSGDVERDRRRKNTAKSMISPSEGGVEREQTIYTPKIVLDVIAEVWPEGIQLDPCSGPDSDVVSKYKYNETDDGLICNWFSRTYCNPPYKNLKDWLAKADTDGADGIEIIVLCPVRTHRKWFRRTMERCTAICWMDPLKFKGYAQAFPAPLCLLYWGNRKEAFLKASRKLSKD